VLALSHQSDKMSWIAAALGIAGKAPRIPIRDAPASAATIVTIGLNRSALP
jgi:hypothetical protein